MLCISYKCINVIIALLRGYFSSGAVTLLNCDSKNWKQYFILVVLNWRWSCLSEDIWPSLEAFLIVRTWRGFRRVYGCHAYLVGRGQGWNLTSSNAQKRLHHKKLSNPMCQLGWSWETPLYINVHLEPIEPFYFKVRTGHFLTAIHFATHFHNSITFFLPIKLVEENLPP